MELDKEFLAILACPVCKGDLTPAALSLTCIQCRLVYPICDGIPVMLPEEAKPLLP